MMILKVDKRLGWAGLGSVLLVECGVWWVGGWLAGALRGASGAAGRPSARPAILLPPPLPTCLSVCLSASRPTAGTTLVY